MLQSLRMLPRMMRIVFWILLDGGKRHYIPEHGIKTIAVGDIVAVWWNDTGEMRPGFATNGWVDCKVCGACF